MLTFKQGPSVSQSVSTTCHLEDQGLIFLLFFIQGVQVSTDPKTKDAKVQCNFPCTKSMKDASVQCRRHTLVTSSPVLDHQEGPSETEFSDIEGYSHAMDASGCTFHQEAPHRIEQLLKMAQKLSL